MRILPFQAGLLVVTSFLFVACGPAAIPTGTAASPGAASAPPSAMSGALFQESILFRSLRGLRADEAWVREVAADARSTMAFGVPLLPDEAAGLEARPREFPELVPLLQDYAAQYPGEFGGMYVDPPGGTRVILMFTRRLAEHEAALAKLVHPAVWLQLRETPIAESDLDALMERIGQDQEALREIGAFVVEMSRNDAARTVDVRLSTERSDAPGLFVGLYGPNVTTEVIDPTGAYLKPRATLVGRTVDASGGGVAAVIGLKPLFAAGLPFDSIGYEPDPDGTFRFEDQLPGRWLVTADAAGYQVVSMEAELTPGAVTTLEIVMRP